MTFWRLEHLSDAELIDGLARSLRSQRRVLAEVVAHLGEVEERRLHLAAAYGSMFDYCVRGLGMSEDEACRRVDLARLARKYPALFAELASGRINLSVALVLKPVLSAGNHLELIAAVRGVSIRQAREVVAERFPSPDVASSIRKLPERGPPLHVAATGGVIGFSPGVAQVGVGGGSSLPTAVTALEAPTSLLPTAPLDIPGPRSRVRVPLRPVGSTRSQRVAIESNLPRTLA